MSRSTYKARLLQRVQQFSEDQAERALAILPGALWEDTDSSVAGVGLADHLEIGAVKVRELRYGENPHQAGALYALEPQPCGLAGARQLQGPAMSFTHWLDADSAHSLVSQFEQPAAAIIKHTNPCGFAVGVDIASAYRLAYECERVRAATVLAHASAAGVLGTTSPTALAETRSGCAERRSRKLTNSASVAAVGRLAYQRRSASCASTCSGTVRVRPRLDARTTTSSLVCSLRPRPFMQFNPGDQSTCSA